MWSLDRDAVDSIAIGAGILGTGGGGNPYLGRLRTRQVLGPAAVVPVLDPEELPADAVVICVGGIGAPTVGVEKTRGMESLRALRTLEKHIGAHATAVMADEIGGSNGLEPILVAAAAGLPVVDADGMGRAFPEIQMTSFCIYGVPATPAMLCDEKGNTVVLQDACSAGWVERLARAVTVAMGCVAAYAHAPMSGAEVRRTAIPRTLSLAHRVGEAVRRARAAHADPGAAILAAAGGRRLFTGKVVDVERRTTAGFARGTVRLSGSYTSAGSELAIDFQNENLVARIADRTICTVPDLICVVERDTGEPVTTEILRYGLRVAVLGLPAPTLLRAAAALAVVGPRAFGYDLDYRPLDEGEECASGST